MATARHDGRRRIVAAVDESAARLGLRPGMAVAQALAMVPDLHVAEAEPEDDAGALRRLAAWCHRYTPLVSLCPPDGLWLEVGGSAHLFGGDHALLTHLITRLARDGLKARGAVADTPGAAFALARHGASAVMVAARGEQSAAIAGLPVSCLRLPPELEGLLPRLGFDQVRQLTRVPRPLLARRFGVLVGLRLDQAQGTVRESIVPIRPEQPLHRRETFLEPLSTPEALAIAIIRLVVPLCQEMEGAGLGARRLDLLFERIDSQIVALCVGTVRPTRDAPHLIRLLNERLDTVEPGDGIEAMQLLVPLAQPLPWDQQTSGAGQQDMARLVDRLGNRLGHQRVYRAAPVEIQVPENLVRKAAASEIGSKPVPEACKGSTDTSSLDPASPNTPVRPTLTLVASTPHPLARNDTGAPSARPPKLHLVKEPEPDLITQAEAPVVLPWKPRHDTRRDDGPPSAGSPKSRGHGHRAWPSHLKAPARLLSPPLPVIAIASLPEEAPVVFTWRRKHKVTRSEGPERIHETWWHDDRQADAVRDYFQVEVEDGQRFWLFRRGNGQDPATGDLSWFLHGIF